MSATKLDGVGRGPSCRAPGGPGLDDDNDDHGHHEDHDHRPGEEAFA